MFKFKCIAYLLAAIMFFPLVQSCSDSSSPGNQSQSSVIVEEDNIIEMNPDDNLFNLFTSELIFEGVAIDPLLLQYNPTGEVIFSSIIKASDHSQQALGEYYLYYSPHDSPGGISISYSDSLDGPWFEYEHNPVIGNDWPPFYRTSHVSSPHVIWIEEKGRFYLYFHGENDTTRYAVSVDGLSFEYRGIALTNPSKGTWSSSKSNEGYYGSNYIHDQNSEQGSKAIRYNPQLLEGFYTLSMNWISEANRASNVKIIVKSQSGIHTFFINQQENGGKWNQIGDFYFDGGQDSYVEIRNDDANGYVVADAIKFESESLNETIIIDNTDDSVTFFNSHEGPSLASYARVFKYSIPGSNNRYIMTFMGELNGKLRIFLATSLDAEIWEVRDEPIVSSNENEGLNLSGAFFFKTGGKYYTVYHASSGRIYFAETGAEFNIENHRGVLFGINETRIAAPFIFDSGAMNYLFFDIGKAGNTKIGYSIFQEQVTNFN